MSDGAMMTFAEVDADQYVDEYVDALTGS